GKVLANGTLLVTGLTNNTDQNMMTFILASDGTLVASYGVNGIMEYDVPNQKMETQGFIAEDANGKIYLCGSSAQGQANLDLVVAKLKTSATTVSLGELNENS